MVGGSDLSDAKRLLLERLLRDGQTSSASKALSLPSIPKRSSGNVAPLSTSQEQVWVHAQMDLRHPVYNELVTIHRRGSLDLGVLNRTLVELVRRHEMWRTNFDLAAGAPVQIVQPAPFDVDLPFTDLRTVSASMRKTRALQLAEEDGHIPFDLSTGLLWRARVVRMEDEYYLLFMTMHQIIMDGITGFRVLLPEIAAIYEAYASGLPSPLEELPFQYSDYTTWQRNTVTDEVLAPQLAFWKERLAGELPVLQWPNDRPRPPVQTLSGATESLTFPGALVSSVRSMASNEGATLYMALLASFAALMHRYTGQQKIILGTLTAGRKRPDVEKLMGYFLNPLVLPIDLSGEPSFRELLRRVREVVLGALANPDVPFLRLVKELQPGRDLSRNPFFTVIVSLEPPMAPTSSAWDFTLTEASSGGAKLDLYLNLYERPDGIAIPIMYNPDLFERSTVLRMHEHWHNIMEAACADPDLPVSGLSFLSDAEHDQLVHHWNATSRPCPQTCIHQLIEQQARKTPNKTAVFFEKQALTYAELNGRSNQLAHYLRKLGAGPETRVGIGVARSLDMIVGLLGIMKSGAAYVPMDPDYPRERLELMRKDATCTLIVTQKSLARELSRDSAQTIFLDADRDAIARESDENPHVEINPNHLAYVIYTSGSTGIPKGVEIEHRSVVNLLVAMQSEPGFAPQDILVAVTSISFDIAGLELYLPLITGGQLVIAGNDVVMDGAGLLNLLAATKATVMQATPTTWRLLIAAGWAAGNLKVLCGGEALPAELARELTARSHSVWNLYGPTETTIWSAVHRVLRDEGGAPPIGRPIDNTEFYVLDGNRRLAPRGIPGELYIAGDGVARGYLNRPGETQSKFVANPFGSSTRRKYRTGDLVRYRENGDLEFLGRIDNQVKIRGFRVELGEIESALATHPAVRAAAAVIRGKSQESLFVAAYVIFASGQSCSASDLIDFVRGRLPGYMVPSRVMVCQEFPLTPNKKVDRLALPDPEALMVEAGPCAEPRTSVELRLLGIWESVLNRKPLGIRDNFFDVGGHSLLAAQLIRQIEQAFAVRFSMATLFQAPTVGQMGKLLAAERQDQPVAEAIPMQPRGKKPPFFCICVDAGPMYLPLLRHLDQDQPFVGIHLNPELVQQTTPPYQMNRIAEFIARAIRDHQPQGPYQVGGYCISGLLAYVTAEVLVAQGEEVAAVGLFLSSNPVPRDDFSKLTQIKALLHRVTLRKLWNHAKKMRALEQEEKADIYVRSRVGNVVQDFKLLLWQIGFSMRSLLTGGRLRAVREILFAAGRNYVPRPIPARVALFRSQAKGFIDDPTWGWAEVVPPERLTVNESPGNDLEIFSEPNVGILAGGLQQFLREAQEPLGQRGPETLASGQGEASSVAA